MKTLLESLKKVAAEHPETRKVLLPLIKEAVSCGEHGKIAALDPIIKRIGDLVKGKKLVDLRKPLETIFPKKAIDFSFEVGGHFTVKYKGKTIILVNKKYADDPDLVVDDIAIGFAK
jgi:hypothetical protein